MRTVPQNQSAIPEKNLITSSAFLWPCAVRRPLEGGLTGFRRRGFKPQAACGPLSQCSGQEH